MPGTEDRTRDAPVRRMAVARGTLTAPRVDLDEAVQERATASALLAVKDTPRLLPFTDAFQPTHVDVLFQAGDDGIACTVTVQAHARSDLGQAALLGVAAALSALADPDKASIRDLQVVQAVTG